MVGWIYICLGLIAILPCRDVETLPTKEPIALKRSNSTSKMNLRAVINGSTPPPKSKLEHFEIHSFTQRPKSPVNITKTMTTHSKNSHKRRKVKSKNTTTHIPKLPASKTFKSNSKGPSAYPEFTKRQPIQPPTWYRIMLMNNAGKASLVGPIILLSPEMILVSYYNHKYALSAPYNDTTYTTFSSIVNPTINPIKLGALPVTSQNTSNAKWPKLSATLKHIGLVMFKAPQGFLNDTRDQLHTIIPDNYPDEDCYAVKFYPKQLSNSSTPAYVYAKVPVSIDIDLCDGRFCYGRPVKKVTTPRNDLTGMHNSGVPIFCNGSLSYINMPRPHKGEIEYHRLVPIQVLAEELRRYKYSVYKKVFTNPKEPILVPE